MRILSTWLPRAISLTMAMLCYSTSAFAQELQNEDLDNSTRPAVQKEIHWLSRQRDVGNVEHLRLITFNDFHGKLSAGQKVSNRGVGGAAVLASWIKDAEKTAPDSQYLVLHDGDQVGGSPPVSALLRDEPSLSFLNILAGNQCHNHDTLDSNCNVVGTVGNHELDLGKNELFRKLFGGNSDQGPFLENPWGGVHFPYVNANIVDSASGKTILPPYGNCSVIPSFWWGDGLSTLLAPPPILLA